ncbi:MAG: B12-binding domain-containing radical SAM protein, partial [Draconibacterium sp.]
MQAANPSFNALGENYYDIKLSNQLERIYKMIESKTNELPTDSPFIFGVSAKFDSWISGLVVALEVKKRRPNAICILGGIEEESAANALFQEFDIFDYVIWGEGEIPLNLLTKKLLANEKNYSEIPRLLFRGYTYKEQESSPNEAIDNSGFLNFNEYPDINYTSYFNYAKDIGKESIQLPIETSRGCRWNKCNFCALSWGNLYRTQNIDNVVDQIRSYYLKYEIVRFFFVDNDTVGKKISQFEELLDKLISLTNELEVDFDFHTDILHLNFNKRIIKKLSLAGFKSVQIGYEGVSDGMLKKLNKSTTFADNLLFIKFAQKYDIEITISGLIIGIPNEVETDVYESTNNLHFLRFFLGKRRKELQHTLSKLVLFYKTKFWQMTAQRERFNINILNDFFPKNFTKNESI